MWNSVTCLALSKSLSSSVRGHGCSSALKRCFSPKQWLKHIYVSSSWMTGKAQTAVTVKSTHFKQIAVVIHHEQDHEVHFSFWKSSTVDNGTWERPFHRHFVLNLTRDLCRVNKNQRHSWMKLWQMHTYAHLFVQFDLLWFGCDRHESEESTQLLPAARVLQLQAQL